MLNRIAELSLTENFDADQIYYLFKTDDSDKNLQILSKLRKFTTVLDLFNYFTSHDASLITKTLKMFEEQLFLIFEKIDYTTHFSENEVESYMSDVSKIILPLYIILQIENSLNGLLIGLKGYLSKLHSKKIIKDKAKKQIINCINKLICKINYESQNTPFSRSSTKENTAASRNFSDLNEKKLRVFTTCHSKSVKRKKSNMPFKRKSINNEEILVNLDIQKSDDEITLKNLKTNNEVSVNKSKTKDSELSLNRLIFDEAENYLSKKNKSLKQKNTTKENNFLMMNVNKEKIKEKDNAVKIRSPKNVSFKLIETDELGAKKLPDEYIRKRVRSRSDCLNPQKETGIDKTKIFMESIECINELYKKMKINAEEKVSLKKLITNPNNLHNIYQEVFIKNDDIGKDINIRNKLMNILLNILGSMKEVDK